MTGKLKGIRNELGKRPPKGAGLWIVQNRSVRLKRKNEPVVGRNIFYGA